MLTLLSEAAEFALDCLEKRDALVPFIKLRTKAGEVSFICVDDESTTFEEAARAVRLELKRRVETGAVAEFAICADKEVKYQHEAAPRRVLEVEFQNGTAESAIYHFPLTVQNGRASVDGKYLTVDLKEKWL
jgi:hypothetical protein